MKLPEENFKIKNNNKSMSFLVSEKELVNKFINLQDIFLREIKIKHSPKMEHEEEVDIGYGISDIFYYNVSKEVVCDRKKISNIKIKDRNLIETLIKIGKKERISINQLNKITNHLSPYSQKKVIKNLIDNNFIHENSLKKEIFCVTKKYYPRFDNSIAIEAKLKNWKRALFQAHRYNFVADQSFVVLPEKFMKPAIKNISYFIHYNVGLIGVTKDTIKVHYVPKKNPSKYKNKVMTGYTLENLIFKN